MVVNLNNVLQVKLWDLSNNQPSCIASRNPKAVCDLQIFVVEYLFDTYFSVNLSRTRF